MTNLDGREAALSSLLRERSSVRAFLKDPVSDAQIERILTLAAESPSWSNTQPYVMAVANGAACDALRNDMLQACETQVPEGEYPLLFEYPTPLKERRQATGYGLYAALGIAREDREARAGQFRRNYAFFDAPCVMFLFAHDALGHYAVLDAGIYLQSVLLAAQAIGLSTCAQAALAGYPAVVRKHFDVQNGYKLLCGVALGVRADEKVNVFRPARLTARQMMLTPRGA